MSALRAVGSFASGVVMLGGDELIEYGADYLSADGPSLDDGDLEFLDEIDLGGVPPEYADLSFQQESGARFLSRQR